MSYDWLQKQLEENKAPDDYKQDIPAGGDFVRGFTGNWKQQMLYRLYSTADVDLNEYKPDHQIATRNQGGIWWYWNMLEGRKELATAAAKAVEARSPNRVWRWEMPTATMLGYQGEEPAVDKFGDTVSIDISVVGLKAKSNIELHLLFLPSFVQEMALISGMIKERVFNYDGLLVNPDDVGEAYCTMMHGEVQDNGTVDYTKGELWAARVALWAALGEENPTLWSVGGTPLTNVTSQKLVIPISVMDSPGLGFWMRMTRVAAPRMPTQKEIENDRKPFGMNVVTQVWMNKEDAVKDIEPDNDMDHPPIPELWEDTPVKDFREWVVKFMADNEYEAMPTPAVLAALKKRKDLESSLALKVDELIAWVKYIRNE